MVIAIVATCAIFCSCDMFKSKARQTLMQRQIQKQVVLMMMLGTLVRMMMMWMMWIISMKLVVGQMRAET